MKKKTTTFWETFCVLLNQPFPNPTNGNIRCATARLAIYYKMDHLGCIRYSSNRKQGKKGRKTLCEAFENHQLFRVDNILNCILLGTVKCYFDTAQQHDEKELRSFRKTQEA